MCWREVFYFFSLERRLCFNVKGAYLSFGWLRSRTSCAILAFGIAFGAGLDSGSGLAVWRLRVLPVVLPVPVWLFLRAGTPLFSHIPKKNAVQHEDM